MNDLSELAGLRNYPMARRGLFGGGLMTGLTLLTTRVEAQVVHTDVEGLATGEARVAEGAVPVYWARPSGVGPFPIVLVNEEAFGVHDYIKDVCRRLAKLGYLAVAPEIYAREGDIGKVADMGQLQSQFISKAPDARVQADFDATVAWAQDNGGDAARVGVVGFCRGGRNTWMFAAHSPTVKAAVAWYGPIGGARTPIQPTTVMDIAAEIHCPMLGLYGGQDTGIKVDDVQAAAAAARNAGRTVEIVIYPDAPHGFHADYRPSYRAADAADGWARTLAWFKKYGVA